ncbi:terminase small subunit [Bacillus mycoides]|nr:terminase small subunit [Bacillus mycoides]
MSNDMNHQVENPQMIEHQQSITASPSKYDNVRMMLTEIPEELTASLSPNKITFVQNLIANNLNVKKSSEDAGFTESYGRKLLKNYTIRQYYTALSNANAFFDIVHHNEALKLASDIARGNTTDEVLNMKTGEVATVKTPTKDKLKAIEMLMKHQRILNDGISKEDLLNMGATVIHVDISEDDESIIQASAKRSRKDVTDESEYIEL